MFVDFVINGPGGITGGGEVGEALQATRFDPGFMRPFLNRKRQKCVTVHTGRQTLNEKGELTPEYKTVLVSDLMRRGYEMPVYNAMTLRRDEWVMFDQAVTRAGRGRLRAWSDLAASSTFGGFDGMAKLTLEYESMSDPGEAIVDMEGLADGRTDSPLFKTRSIPLPIIHSDFWFSRRRLAVSRNSGTPLDTTMAEAAGRRVAEMIEKITIGVEAGINFGTDSNRHEGNSQVYGYTNFPQRMTKTDLTTPNGTNASSIIGDIIEMREEMYASNFFGPFMVYHTPSYDAYLDMDYILTGGNVATQTLRQRIEAIDGVQGMRRLDFWTGSSFQMIMVQMQPETARAINGMDFTTVQWESQGGMRLNFKVMAIQLPQLRTNYAGDAGIIHATTA